MLRTFTREALDHFQTTAAIAPSSRHLTQAMVAPLHDLDASTVVEFGSGTGAITGAILQMMPQSGRLIAFEVNHRFVEHVRRNIRDRRLLLLECSAGNAGRELMRLGCKEVDAVISSLAMGFLSDKERSAVLQGIVPFLRREGVLTQYQYIHGLQYRAGHFSRFSTGRLLNGYFAQVRHTVVWRNLPPARVFTCHV
jgi:phospholipid N-methyltransferase